MSLPRRRVIHRLIGQHSYTIVLEPWTPVSTGSGDHPDSEASVPLWYGYLRVYQIRDDDQGNIARKIVVAERLGRWSKLVMEYERLRDRPSSLELLVLEARL